MDNIQPGQTLGAYRILNQIGQGGMATVYKAYHAAMDRYIAIKILPRQLAESPEFTGRFQQEARIIANLEHPHILPVHDYGETDGVTYLIMRYMDAGTLKDRMKTGLLPLAEIDRLFSQLADALDYAHSKGVIHRDLKPANVLVDARGSVFLTDFGIAKLLESSSQFTGTGAMVGTPAYMSPEQAQGFKVDQRTDIYALGIILYEMVTGRVPYEAETPLAVILKHLNDPLPLPTQVKADLSPAIERVLLKALAKAPDDRYESVAGFLAAWKHALTETDTVRAQPAPVVTPSPFDGVVASAPAALPPEPVAPAPARPKVKTPLWVLILAGLGALLVCCVGLFLITAPGRRANNQRATQTALHATQTAQAQVVAPSATARTSVAAGPSPSETPTTVAVATGADEWTSWTGANLLNGLTVYQDEVIAWGAGGVTVWNRADGALKEHIASSVLWEPYVRTVLMDTEKGTLWIGGDGGLATNDSGEWHTFNADNGLDSWQVGALGWAKDPGGLIIGTLYSGAPGGGLMLYDGQSIAPVAGFPSAQSDEHPELLSYNVQTLLVDYENNVWWVGTSNGLGRYDVAQNSWTAFFTESGLPSNNIESLQYSGNNTLGWVGTSAGLARFNGESFERFAAPDGSGPDYDVLGLAADGAGNGWVSGGGGVWRYGLNSGQWEYFDPSQHPQITWNMTGAAADADGNLYFASYGGGIVKYANGEFEEPWLVENTIGVKGMSRILPAPDGKIWFVEEYGAQTNAIDPDTDTWSLVDLPCDYCVPLAFDDESNLWLGGEEGVWIQYADGRETLHLTTDNSFLPDNRVYSIAFGADGYVAAGTAGGVVTMNDTGVTGVFNSAAHGLASDNVHAVLVTEDGALWVATDGGVSRMGPDGAWVHYGMGNPFHEGFDLVSDLAEDTRGAIWAATGNNGAWRYAEGEWEHFETDSLWAVTAAPDGSVWFGTYYHDAVRFADGEWQTFGVSDGLVQSNVNDIYVDETGAVWFATSGGVSRYKP